RVGSITPDGVVSLFGTNGGRDIVAGPDGNLHFTPTGALLSVLGKVTPDGTVSFDELPAALTGQKSIVTGPDGNLWITLDALGDIGVARLSPDGRGTGFAVPHSG